MSDCGDTGMLEGGIIKDSNIISSTVTTSTIEASNFTGGTIESLTGVDAVSAKRILDAIVALGPDQLAALAQAMLTSAAAVSAVASPASSDGATTPTSIIGNRASVLGQPATWTNIGGYAVPMYVKGA